jgi:hypothetical protein
MPSISLLAICLKNRTLSPLAFIKESIKNPNLMGGFVIPGGGASIKMTLVY